MRNLFIWKGIGCQKQGDTSSSDYKLYREQFIKEHIDKGVYGSVAVYREVRTSDVVLA